MPKDQQEHVNELLTEEELAAANESDFYDDEEDGAESEGDTTPQRAATEAEDEDEDDEDDEQDGTPAAAPQEEAAAEVDLYDGTAANIDTAKMQALKTEYASLNAEMKALKDQYNDGDFTSEEFDAKTAELTEKLVDVASDTKLMTKMVADDTASWNKAVDSYFTANPGLAATDAVINAYDAIINDVTRRFPNLTFQQQLTKAHASLLNDAADLGLEGVPPLKGGKATGKATVTPPKPAARQQADDGMRTPPVTLARAQASEVSGEADSALLQMQKLSEGNDPEAFESAMRRLTPEQRDAFSNMDLSG